MDSVNTLTFHPSLTGEQLDALLNGRILLGNYRPTSSAAYSPIFRLARPDDQAALYALSDGSLTPFQFRQHVAQLLKWQTQQRCCWLVVEAEDGSLVGSGQLICYPHVAELANLSVAPAWRGQRWGTRLIELLTAVAHYWHISYLEIVVDAENGRALALYQRLNFVEDRRLFLPDGRTAIILGKEIVNYEL
jgi:ribosomal protein S18 acetylase RimI-like enzyme